MLARERAHVGHAIGIGAGASSSSGQRLAIHVGVGGAEACAGQAARRS